MKNSLALLLIPLLLLLAGQADASGWFKVINVTPIEMTANSEANFTVSVKGMGGERAYVELVFKNKSGDIDFNCPKMIKNVFPAGVTNYSCSVKAGNVAVGNYSFVVDTAAKGARPGKMTAYINVVPEKSPKEAVHSTNDYLNGMANGEESKPSGNEGFEAPVGEAAEQSPMPGVASAILCLLIALRRINR